MQRELIFMREPFEFIKFFLSVVKTLLVSFLADIIRKKLK